MSVKLVITSVLIGCFFIACRHKNRYKEMDAYFNKEINDRIGFICAQPDSLSIDPLSVNGQVTNLMLMSKDVENITVAISRTNAYFKTLAGKYQLNPADFGLLTPGMEPDQMESLMKENELNFFNQVIFKMKPAGSPQIYTAH